MSEARLAGVEAEVCARGLALDGGRCVLGSLRFGVSIGSRGRTIPTGGRARGWPPLRAAHNSHFRDDSCCQQRDQQVCC